MKKWLIHIEVTGFDVSQVAVENTLLNEFGLDLNSSDGNAVCASGMYNFPNRLTEAEVAADIESVVHQCIGECSVATHLVLLD